MAKRVKTQEGDAISRLADAGEDALRRLVELPRRTFAGTIDRVEKRLHEVEARIHDLAARVRAIDPLDGRVAAIEKRLDALEKRQTTARRSTRPRHSSARSARTAQAAEPEQEGRDPGRLVDARTEDEPEQATSQAN